MACSILLNEVRSLVHHGLIRIWPCRVLCCCWNGPSQPSHCHISCCAPQRDEFIRLITNSVRNDLICRNEAFQCLALNFIGSGGSNACGCCM